MTAEASNHPTEDLDAQLARFGLPARGVADRQAALPEPLRQFHRRLLGHFLTHAGPPDRAALASIAGEFGLDLRQALATLADNDVVHADQAGTVRVAYPFSGPPTPHRVRLGGGPAVHAMCALDALGIPQMTGRDARILSTDPASGREVTVDAIGEAWRFEPATTVVLVGATTGAGGAVAELCCPHINFHADPRHAEAFLRAHPGMAGEVLSQDEAIELAGQVFARLLHPDRTTPPRRTAPKVQRSRPA